MAKWTHLIRFVSVEDNTVHLGQPVDTSRDIGRDVVNHIVTRAYLVNGSIFGGEVTDVVMTVLQLLSPVSREDCNYIRCIGMNYKDHAKEIQIQLPKVPSMFTKPRGALCGPFPATISIPKVAQDGTSDYEAELAVVIGKDGRNILEETALDYVLGYTVANDVSARNLQMETEQWSFSKGLDGACALGPVLVSPDVIENPHCLSVQTTYNGNLVQDGNTDDLVFSVQRLIAHCSQGTTLEAGTIILTGTPAGVGFARDPRIYLQDGSQICVTIEKIGTLMNRVLYEDW